MPDLPLPFALRACAAVLLAAASLAVQASYPDRPLRLIVPSAAGGSTDLLARQISIPLSRQLGQPVVVENKPGAGTAIGAQSLAAARPDGYTLMLTTNSTFTLNPALSRHAPTYDPVKDFEPVATIADLPLVLAIRASYGISTVQELIAAAKAAPDTYRFSSFGQGTGSHFAGANFEAETGVKLGHVPYQGGPPSVHAMLGGQTAMTVNSVMILLPHIKAGTVRALAVTTPQRSGLLPDVPTLAEAGYPQAGLEGWSAIVAPRGTPAEAISQLQAALSTIMAEAAFRKQLVESGFDPAYRIIGNWAEFVTAETNRFRQIVERTGLARD
ncbi:Tripartite tricarboxylate transporter family receptor [Pigmentiphaga humi]|uniref:Tripartite tricarboxylate transporter family receptor n=1 Tax=Pigmentiphaga humi TaxID=2478468 RepID=A0A3P4AYX6_9BURK|nr:tripartite tricarboxylate transporter substrate binding protein [Pigmentiphaga humi]VCU69289.1 Tripartite tricarboxylate transporter family receptor [Pigmentiphaga humi]